MPLIVLEGPDGCGKSTQAGLLTAHLQAAGRDVLRLREPGGTKLGEAVRGILLDPATQACAEAELFGYQMARAQLCREVIAPALAAGRWIVLDRFWHSTIAYQAYGLGLDPLRVRAAIDLAVGPVRPDLALLLRIPDAVASARRGARGAADRIESRGDDYRARVLAGYEALAASGDLSPIDADGTADEVSARIRSRLPATG
ncbi:MAG: dTMP kinase [Planctomycetes bacterium]|nr:dTMP kinase [Planctomycetota bacterium]